MTSKTISAVQPHDGRAIVQNRVMGNRLARARAERGWKKARLIHELRAAATRRDEKLLLPKDESLGRRIAKWENQGGEITEFYRDLLCDVYGCSAAELGLLALPPPMPDPPAMELAERLTFSQLDAGLVEMLGNHTQSIRMLDRRLGGSVILQQTTAHMEHIEQLVRYALPGAVRESAADQLGQAAALAGWQALDVGRLDEAWRFHELAQTAARESGVTAGFSYARAQQGYVLLDAGRPEDALALIVTTREQTAARVPPALRAWLHAAEGEALAILGERDASLRALDLASSTLPAGSDGSELPYLMLDADHLARWRGHCLARLGDSAAIDDLTSALGAMGAGNYGRAEARLRVDLALALRARGDVTESRTQARHAAALADRTGSQRERRRIADLLS